MNLLRLALLGAVCLAAVLVVTIVVLLSAVAFPAEAAPWVEVTEQCGVGMLLRIQPASPASSVLLSQDGGATSFLVSPSNPWLVECAGPFVFSYDSNLGSSPAPVLARSESLAAHAVIGLAGLTVGCMLAYAVMRAI